jgi:putative peptide zinc metalloprotease protein
MTADPINPYWQHLAALRPRLAPHVRIDRQEVRGQLWYIIRDATSGRQFRVTPEAWHFVGLLDGERSVEAALEASQAVLGDMAPGEGEATRLLTQLSTLGLMVGEGSADAERLYDQAAKLQRSRRIAQMRTPLAIRFPLFDPDRVLVRLAPLGRAIFSRIGFLVWLVVIGYGITTALLNSDELSANMMDRLLSAENVLAMTAIFAVLKLFHEFGHGLAVRRWGGEVHEMGIMLLVLIPVPYVDATAANEFHTKLRRAIVSAAGMYVELFLAALAIILWARVEPGMVRAGLYNAALIGSVSTLVFNLNPLLRFDGYYILSDLIGIPNLGTRSNAYFKYLVQRYVLFLDDSVTPETQAGEKRWLVFYAIAAFLYRIVIVLAIALAVSQMLFFVGVALAAWAVAQFVLLPIYNMLKFLFFSPRLKGGRVRVILRAIAATGVLAFLFFVVPAPRSTLTWGVVWVPEGGEVVAGSDGFVREIAVADGQAVEMGQVLYRLDNERTEGELARLQARRRALQAQIQSDFVDDRVAQRVTQLELDQVERRIAEAQDRIAALTLDARIGGIFSLALSGDLTDRYLMRGERLGFVIPPDQATVRVAVSQQDVDLVRASLDDVRLMSVGDGGVEGRGELVREVPASSTQLPSLALSVMGGGDIAVAQGEDGQPAALTDVFHLEIRPERVEQRRRVGEKIRVKFQHEPVPIGQQAFLRLRQLFLSEFNV